MNGSELQSYVSNANNMQRDGQQSYLPDENSTEAATDPPRRSEEKERLSVHEHASTPGAEDPMLPSPSYKSPPRRDATSGRSLSERFDRWAKLLSSSANEWWLFEILSAMVSIACFVGLVITLRDADGKPQSSWFDDRLTLNTVVALYTAFMKAAMAVPVTSGLSQLKWNLLSSARGRSPRRLKDFENLDQASRGPWGSMKTLLIPSGLHIGYLGAAITVLALTYGPFSQNVIGINLKDVANYPGTSAGRVERSDYYNHYEISNNLNISITGTDLVDSGSEGFSLDFALKAAVNSAVFNAEPIAPKPVECTTGNCTWPLIPTLGVCGSCTNITNSVKETCWSSERRGQICSYTLDDGGGFNFTFAKDLPRQYNDIVWKLQTTLLRPYGQWGDGWKPINPRRYFTQFAVFDFLHRLGPPVTAHACGLWVCVQVHNITARNGRFNQALVRQDDEPYQFWPNKTSPPLEITSYLITENGSITDKKFIYEGGYWNFTESVLNINHLGLKTKGLRSYPYDAYYRPSLKSYADPTINFTITGLASQAIEMDTLSSLSSSVTWGGGNESSAAYNHKYSSEIARSLSRVTDWDAWINNTALSMTNVIRAQGNDTFGQANHTLFAGTAYMQIPHVRVRWRWLAFPAVMMVASLCFLAGSMWNTFSIGAQPRKTNTAALILASADDELASRRWIDVKEEKVVFDSSQGQGIFRTVVR